MDGPPELRPGALVAGKYRVDRTLGRGGMGLVLGATNEETGEHVAIKVLQAAALQNKEAVARFEREARAAAKMSGDYAARIFEVGTLESHAPYIVMEHLEGEDLARILKRRGPLPVAEAVDYVAEACEALARAHGAGVVHRDLKPGNLFVTQGDQRIKILDFGISKVRSSGHDEGESTLTTTESFLGSPVYMSPEQMAAPKKVDTRTDIWALGVTLYRLLTRRAPFAGDTPMAMCGLILSGARPAPVRATRVDVPEDLERIVLRCLAREPADRIQDVAELAHAIAPFGTARASAAAERARDHLAAGAAPERISGSILPPVGTPFDADAIETVVDRGVTGTLATWSRSRTRPRAASRRTVVLASAAALAAGAALAFQLMRPIPTSPRPAAPQEASLPAPAPAPVPVPVSEIQKEQAPPKPSASATAVPVKVAGPMPKRVSSAASTSKPAPTALPGGVFGDTPF